MARLNWLHFSDLHMGMAEQQWLWPRVRGELFEDLARLHSVAGPWHLLLFTGDLTRTGASDEYKVLSSNIQRILAHLKKLGSEPAILCIPGNHDLVRPDAKAPVVKAFQKWHEDEEIRDQLFSDKDNDYKKTIRESFSNYTAWWGALPTPYSIRQGVLPGDFSVTVDVNGVRLGVVGLNSAFLQLTGGDYQGKLGLDVRQLSSACGDIRDWHDSHHASFLMTHHPVDWLRDRKSYESDIAPPGDFAIHFCGHMHENSGLSISQSGGLPRHFRQAASLFGLDTYGEEREEVKRNHGWMAGRITLGDNGATTGRITTWPRRLVPKANGGSRLQADHTWTLSDVGTDEVAVECREANSTSTCDDPVPMRDAGGGTVPVNLGKAQTVLVLALGEAEYLTVLDWMPGRKQMSGRGQERYDVASLATVNGAVTVVVARPSVGTAAEVSAVAEAALRDHSPDWTICIGTGSALPSTQVWLGDVVVANEFAGALGGKGVHPKAKAVLGVLPAIAREDGWRQRIASARPASADVKMVESTVEQHHRERPRQQPLARPGQLLGRRGGPADGSADDRVSMEEDLLFSLAMTCERASQPALVVGGVRGIVGGELASDWRGYSGEAAAAFVCYLIQIGTLATPPSVASVDTGQDRSGTDGFAAWVDLAISNVVHFGDTDVFPRAYENGAFRDLSVASRSLVLSEAAKVDELRATVPGHISTLAHASLSGYRWVTLQDPMFNLLLLASSLSIANQLEAARIPVAGEVVYSYRFSPRPLEGRLFDDDQSWDAFLARARTMGEQHEYIVRMDIAEFYARVSHEKLADSLLAATTSADRPTVGRILRLLRFCTGSSNGLPVGGPAARILAECYLKDTDASLMSEGIRFCRYADDYAAFAASEADARKVVATLSQALYEFDGLSLQKLKTRIMRKSEFLRTFALGGDGDVDRQSMEFLRLRLKFDPYSPSADADYEVLKGHVGRYDVVGMLAREAKKGAVHVQLTRKLLHGARFVADEDVNALAATLADNLRAFAPMIGAVASLVRSILPRLDAAVAGLLCRRFVGLLDAGGREFVTDLQRATVVRLLSTIGVERDLVVEVIEGELSASASPLVRKECLWGVVRLRENRALSGAMSRLAAGCSQWERRALIFGSFQVGETGRLARESISGGMSPFEELIAEWGRARAGLLVEG